MNYTYTYTFLIIISIIGVNGIGNENITFKAYNDNSWNPPDSAIAVGGTHIVTAINGAISIFNKKTQVMIATSTLSSFIVGERGAPFDPRLVWDLHSQRFVGIVTCGFNSGTSNIILFVSRSSTPNGLGSADWYQYIFDKVHDKQWADYPTLGIDRHNIYFSVNMFGDSGAGLVVDPLYPYWIVKKVGVYNGVLDFAFKQFNAPRATVHPAVNYDISNDQYFVNIASTKALRLFKLQGTDNIDLNTLNLVESTVNINFNILGGLSDAVQKDVQFRIETNDMRLQNAFIINRRLYTTLALLNLNLGTTNVAWFEIDIDSGMLVNSDIIGDDSISDSGIWYFYPSVIADKYRNIIMMYIMSSANMYSSVAMSVYNSTSDMYVVDKHILVDGTKPYTKSRYGDYMSISLDSDNLLRFWGMAQVSRGNVGSWEMHVVSTCPGCDDSRENGQSTNLCTGVDCSGHGICDVRNGLCLCQSEWNGNAECSECTDGYYGDNCNLCPLCVHGTCLDGIGGNGTCVCDEGYSGLYCADNNVCDGVLCSGNGNCVNNGGEPVCICDDGYDGVLCDIDLPVVCINGIKSPGNENTCICSCGWKGKNCNICMDEYFTGKCLSCGDWCVHGSCLYNNTMTFCSCDVGYEGELCNKIIDNGGGGSQCAAPPGYCCSDIQCPGSYCKNYQSKESNGYWICQ